MIKRLSKCVREYKLPSVLTVAFIIGEAIIECLIPFLTANLVDKLSAGADISGEIANGVENGSSDKGIGVIVLLAVFRLGKDKAVSIQNCA